MAGNPWGKRGNKVYGWLRRNHSIETSNRLKGNKHAAGRVCSEEEKLKRSESAKKFYENNSRSIEWIQRNTESRYNSDYAKDLRFKKLEKEKLLALKKHEREIHRKGPRPRSSLSKSEQLQLAWAKRRANKLNLPQEG